MSPHPAPRPEPNRQALFVASLIGVGAFAALAALAFPGKPSQPAISAAAPAAPVRVVGAAAFSGDCAEQTWPHIAPHCITSRAAEIAPPAKPAAGGSRVALATPTPGPQTPSVQNESAPPSLGQAIPAEPSTAVQSSPPPPGAEPRQPADIPGGSQVQAVAPGAAAAAAIAGAGATAAMPNLGGESQAKPRSERRRRAVRIHRTPRFNLRIIGFRF
jgi:hypothetical protein